MNSFFNKVKSAVSRDKNRYRFGKYDLDLTYITERIIAMAFPATGVESSYRNNLDDVAELFEEKHADHYLVFNLSQRNYDYSKFKNQVVDCGFPDHHSPPLDQLFATLKQMYDFLDADYRNVVAVHCLAGKGRTGTLIVSFLLFVRLFRSADAALVYFAAKRSAQSWGVTGLSQLRYVRYVETILSNNLVPSRDAFVLEKLIMSPVPQFSYGFGYKGCVPLLQIFAHNGEKELLGANSSTILTFASTNNVAIDESRAETNATHQNALRSSSSTTDEGTAKSFDATVCRHVELGIGVRVHEDICIIMKHIGLYKIETMWRLAFHCGMEGLLYNRKKDSIERENNNNDVLNANDNDTIALEFGKSDLDKAMGDKRFATDFNLKIVLRRLRPKQQQTIKKNGSNTIANHSITTTTKTNNNNNDEEFHRIKSTDSIDDPLTSNNNNNNNNNNYNIESNATNASNSSSTSIKYEPDARATLYNFRPPSSAEQLDGEICFFQPKRREKVVLAQREISLHGDVVTEKAGWLEKRGLKMKSFKKRWFALQNDSLRYFTAPTVNEPQGEVKLTDVWAVRRAPPLDSRQHIVEVVTPHRTFTLAAETHSDAEQWLATLRAAMRRWSPAAVDANDDPVAAHLRVRVVEARQLSSSSDALYCVLEFGRQRVSTRKASAQIGNDGAMWLDDNAAEAMFELRASMVSTRQNLSIGVWAESAYSNDSKLGEAIVTTERLMIEGGNPEAIWLPLKKKGEKSGTILCQIELDEADTVILDKCRSFLSQATVEKSNPLSRRSFEQRELTSSTSSHSAESSGLLRSSRDRCGSAPERVSSVDDFQLLYNENAE